MAQPQIRRNTWDAPPGRPSADAKATELLHVYIYDYCKKHNFQQAARSFAMEANVSVEQQPPIDVATGFLADWWAVFWDIYHAKSKDAPATKDAGIHNEYHEFVRIKKEEALQSQRNMSMHHMAQMQQPGHPQQRRPSQVQHMNQSPQLQHDLQSPHTQPPAQSHVQSVPSQQGQPTPPQQLANNQNHRPSPSMGSVSLPNSNAMQAPQNPIQTPQAMPASLPQQQPGMPSQHPNPQHQQRQVGMNTASPSFSPQQMQRPGEPGADGMVNSPMVSAQGVPMNPQAHMMQGQRVPMGVQIPSALVMSTMAAMGLSGRDPQSLSPEERNALQMQLRKQAGMMNPQAMVRPPGMMGNNVQARTVQQQMLAHQHYYQMQHAQQHGQNPGQPQQPMQPGQPPIPSQQGATPQGQVGQNMPNQQPNQQPPQQPQPPQPPQPGQAQPAPSQVPGQPGHPGNMNAGDNRNQPGNTPRMAAAPGSMAAARPGQMAMNMQNPNVMYGGGEAMMLAQQMMRNGGMMNMTPQQQHMLNHQQQQRMLFNKRILQQQQQQQMQQQVQASAGQPHSMSMGSPNAAMQLSTDAAEKNRQLSMYAKQQQMQHIMQQQQSDQQRQLAQQQMQGQHPSPAQGHPATPGNPNVPPNKRQRTEGDTPTMAHQQPHQSPQMSSPHVMNAPPTPQNMSGSAQASPVMSMQQQRMAAGFNQEQVAGMGPGQSPQRPNQQPPSSQPNQQLQQGGPQPQQAMTPSARWNQADMGAAGSPAAMVDSQQSDSPMMPNNANAAAMQANNSGVVTSFDLERFMMSDGGDFGEMFNASDDNGDPGLLMAGDNNEMFGGGFLASMGGGFGAETGSSMNMDGANGLQLMGELTGHSNKLLTVAFSPDGQWLASAGHDKKVLIWNVQDKRLQCSLEGHTGQITCVRWSPDQRYWLATSSYDKTLRIWDLALALKEAQPDVKPLAKFDCKVSVTAVDFASDRSDDIYSVDAEGELRLWHISTAKCEKVMKLAKSIFSTNPLRCHPRQGNVIVCAAANQLFVIDMDAAKNNASSSDTTAIRMINSADQANGKNILCLDWSSTGQYLVASSESTVQVYDTSQWKVVSVYTASDKIAASAFILPDGQQQVTALDKSRVLFGGYESIYLWSSSSQGTQPKRVASQSGMVAALACTQWNGQTVIASASHSKDKNLMLWSI
ncbi:hypothetical protein DM01DRAFT_1340671 [Hesseltinella vesiculosa]|uniref:WD40 repeat-like protein n=1 Tax=Hesseltinella vesiculosa TaxID=101127 RepID=A0A1X2G3E7_9FUNG|nr:hypothetical protein DM01DRAFT_1340671 [Hesseltinella vesiculosa]